jgi:hypothetical protein
MLMTEPLDPALEGATQPAASPCRPPASISLVFPWLNPGHLSRIHGLRKLRCPGGVPPTFRSGRGIGAPGAGCFANGASACHAEGRGFESLQPLRKALQFAGLFRLHSSLGLPRRRGLFEDRRRPQPAKARKGAHLQVNPTRSNRGLSAGPQKAVGLAVERFGRAHGRPGTIRDAAKGETPCLPASGRRRCRIHGQASHP